MRPLPEQALALVRELHTRRVADQARNGWVFVSPVYPGRPIDATFLTKPYQRIWPEHPITAHGFRATYRTIAHEHLGIDPTVLELSLAHRMPGALGAVMPQHLEAAAAMGRLFGSATQERSIGNNALTKLRAAL